MQLSSPPVGVEKRGKITLGPVILLIVIVGVAFLVYLWFSSEAKGSVRTQIPPKVADTADPLLRPVDFSQRLRIANLRPELPQRECWIRVGEFSTGANDPPDMYDVGMRAWFDARSIQRAYGICEVLPAPRSPWQRAYEEWFGSIRRKYFDHVMVFHKSSLRTTRQRSEEG